MPALASLIEILQSKREFDLNQMVFSRWHAICSMPGCAQRECSHRCPGDWRKKMAKTILLALKRDQKFAESQRHLERVVKPGDRIVFLVEYQLDVPSYLLAHIG